MKFDQTLIEGRLVRRYKRFLADIELQTGEQITAHCANPGAMIGLDKPGITVWLTKSDNPKRKLAYSWELVEFDSNTGGESIFVGINTSRPNKLALEAIRAGLVKELQGYEDIRTEVKYGENSRIDLLLSSGQAASGQAEKCYVEVKNVHLMREDGLAEFPDCETKRGAKHLRELINMRAQGHRAVMLYVVQRNDARRFAIAADKDPNYAKAFALAQEAGVEMICYACALSRQGIEIEGPLPLSGSPP